MSIESIISVVNDDFSSVNELILKELGSNVPFITQVGKYITNSGGKRIRPLVTLLSALSLDYKGKDHIAIAAIIEFLHTSTLLHDDVVDGSQLRRGKATVNNVWGNPPSILVGDFLISRAFEMMVRLENLNILKVLSSATNQIAEGEVLQLLNCRNPKMTEADYYRVIELKTSKMFEAAAECGAIIANKSTELEKALATYAIHLGNTFQLVDDLLDYVGDPTVTGKNIGDDLAEGKLTLPLIYAIQHGSKQTSDILENAIMSGGIEELQSVIDIINSTDAIQYTRHRAQEESSAAVAALNIIPNSPYKDALIKLAVITVERTK